MQHLSFEYLRIYIHTPCHLFIHIHLHDTRVSFFSNLSTILRNFITFSESLPQSMSSGLSWERPDSWESSTLSCMYLNAFNSDIMPYMFYFRLYVYREDTVPTLDYVLRVYWYSVRSSSSPSSSAPMPSQRASSSSAADPLLWIVSMDGRFLTPYVIHILINLCV